MVLTGLDVMAQREFRELAGRKFALLCNQASIGRECEHIISLVQKRGLKPSAIFGPQHGLYGHTQDNMIEWEGSADGEIPIYSLYGKTRKPTPEMLDGIDVLVIDLQDVGARYYTFIWTIALCLHACGDAGVKVLVLDRRNPLGGIIVEGAPQQPGFESFVGLHPIPIRHGKTVGELARQFRDIYYPACEVEVVEMQGWNREMLWPHTGLPWGMPSPNMPTADTSLIYPGGCLLEATNISEGRGTTRPFEIFGAPWIEAETLVRRLQDHALPGVFFRPLEFQPTFNKYVGELCRGAFVHVVDPEVFQPVGTYETIIREIRRAHPEQFRWKLPPYEYEWEKMPIDILHGSEFFRREVDAMR